MDQLGLALVVPASIDEQQNPLDPERYRKDRSTCRFPDLHPSTAYRYACRCVGCRKFHSADNARNTKGLPSQCRYPGCTNPRRRVQAAKYCEDHATSRHYALTEHMYHWATCELCSTEFNRNTSRRKVNTPDLCRACYTANTGILNQLARHHASVEQMLGVLRRPACDICGVTFYTAKNFAGAPAASHVDHDHNCCPGDHSCGRCIRGVLCSRCNLSLGHYEALVARASAERIASYLVSANSLEGDQPSRPLSSGISLQGSQRGA